VASSQLEGQIFAFKSHKNEMEGKYETITGHPWPSIWQDEEEGEGEEEEGVF